MSTAPIDVLALMNGNPTGILNSHLAVAGAGGQPIYPWLNGPAGQFAEMKNAAGWPSDIYAFNTYANDPWIYNTATEVDTTADYSNPKSYRLMQSASTICGGFIWMPRWYTPGSPEVLVQTADSGKYPIRTSMLISATFPDPGGRKSGFPSCDGNTKNDTIVTK
jgi:hypothetical protein